MANSAHDTFLSSSSVSIEDRTVEQAVYSDVSPEMVMEVLARVYTESFIAGRSPTHVPINRKFRKRLAGVRQR